MTYAGLQMFMEKLKQLINCNDNPLTNHPEIIREKPQFQLLYQDLGSIIQILYIGEHQNPHELEKFDDLTKSFIDVAEEAEYIVDLFLSAVHTRYKGNLSPASEEDIKPSLNLDDVRSSLQSVKMDFMSMGINNMELSSSQRPVRMLNQSAATVPGYSSGLKKIPDGMIIVGIDDDAKLIKDKLMEDRKKLDVVSVVGMGGIGKTTLATKVFNDAYVKYHFHVRVWVTVSQTYDKRHVLTQILESIRGQLDLGNGSILETLALSYNHLPLHLRECLLYLGGFPEDYEFKVQWLIWLWMAEGFIQQAGNQSLEDIAEAYLMDLIDRNLVNVEVRSNSNGGVKTCKVHDLVRELCLRKAKEEGFIVKTEPQTSSSHFSNVTTMSYKPVRMFIHKNPNIVRFSYPSAENLRSILCFNAFTSLSDDMVKHFCSFVLLRVLDLLTCRLNDFPKGMQLLVHLRYLAIFNLSKGFPSSICNLWGLQTLIYIEYGRRMVFLPNNISDLVNLRHLLSYHPLSGRFVWTKSYFILRSIDKPMNLQTFSRVMFGHGVDFKMWFPCIKELGCIDSIRELGCVFNKKNNFRCFCNLGKLKLVGIISLSSTLMEQVTLPATLKVLTLENSHLPWGKMSIIQSLPNLQVLKLHFGAFVGSCWNMDVNHGFARLTFLRLEWLDIELWTAEITSFSCLKQLEIKTCIYLEEIPAEIGEIPTLELIKIKSCRQSVGESVRRIQKEQHDFGNYDLQIVVSDDF
ncbi:hypothetical protein E3N88_18760 [Mikania micrantha]|uniref:Uncharacterized protein n=1 Tax=Mikania micrantha TaxID=192012 RepID=A0A5N6NLU5_9ASTR|nr:hypothetical protein E3N88_18760 [Mikania micrantha]